MTDARPIVGVTAGDPVGIGGEIVLRTLTESWLHDRCRPLVFGSLRALERDATAAALDVRIVPGGVAALDRAAPDHVVVHDVDSGPPRDLPPYGVVNAWAGQVAVASVTAAVDAALDGRVDTICTAPLNKAAMWAAGHRYDGHTGLLADLCAAPSACMVLVGNRLRIAHVTTHVALRDVPAAVTSQRVREVVLITHALLVRLGIPQPRIAVAGLNPHAGEGGLFGDEEGRIAPALADLRGEAYDVSGPVAPDTVFVDALEGRYDAVVAMYHDQGHIPIKLVERDEAVNVSAGLPIVRVSVDHGTAFDIAGRGIARIENMRAALRMAIQLSGRRTGRAGR